MSEQALDAPRFQPPFDNIVCPVIPPADHLGFRHIVAYQVGIGATEPGVIRELCARAKAERAPADAVYLTPVSEEDAENGVTPRWVTVGEMQRPANREMITLYVDAMVVYETKLEEYEKALAEGPDTFTYTLTFPSTTTVTVRAGSLKAAHIKLAPADGKLHHEVKQVEPAFPGTMIVQLDRQRAQLVATDDPEHRQEPQPRRMPLSA